MSTQRNNDGAPLPRVYIVIVNFGTGRDTIECLESVTRLDYPDFRIVVVDNGPDPASTVLIRDWAAGTVAAAVASCCRVAGVPPRVALTWLCCGEGELRAVARHEAARLVVIAAGSNRGFAAGANLGMEFARISGDAAYCWLLNNDTVVAPDSLTALVRCAETDPRIGLCGSTLLDYAHPDRVQARGGGRYHPWWGRTQLLGRGETLAWSARRTNRLDFVHGASLLASRRFLESVGPLDEGYFLYFEDLDWAVRAKGSFRLAYAPDSRVWHKDGGAAATPALRSKRADYHQIRNRILFTRRFHRAALPTVYLGLLAALLNRARRGQWDRLRMILRLMLRPA